MNSPAYQRCGATNGEVWRGSHSLGNFRPLMRLTTSRSFKIRLLHISNSFVLLLSPSKLMPLKLTGTYRVSKSSGLKTHSARKLQSILQNSTAGTQAISTPRKANTGSPSDQPTQTVGTRELFKYLNNGARIWRPTFLSRGSANF